MKTIEVGLSDLRKKESHCALGPSSLLLRALAFSVALCATCKEIPKKGKKKKKINSSRASKNILSNDQFTVLPSNWTERPSFGHVQCVVLGHISLFSCSCLLL